MTPVPAKAATRPGAGKLVVVLVLLLVAAGSVFYFVRQNYLPDASSAWCDGNSVAVERTGIRLGVFPPDQLPVTLGTISETVKSLRILGISDTTIEELLVGGTSLMHDWRKADVGSFVRACSAAFDAR